jgi:1-acyl-sn-glycerol-3-phosphate acyltransferase
VLLAIRSGVPILPVGITGTENTASDFKHFRKPHMVATFGEPFDIPVIDRENREESLKQATTEVMCRIAVLLPEKYRGFYKDHPRVKELLDLQGGEVKIHSVRRL